MARDQKQRIRNLTLRLYGCGLPYKHLILVVLVCTLGFSAFDRGRAYLAKVLIDDIAPVWVQGLAPGEVLENLSPEVRWAVEFLDVDPTVWNLMLLVCVVAGIAAVAIAFFGFFRLYYTEYIANRIVVDLQGQIYSHLLRLHMGFFDVGRVGELMARTTADVQITHQALRLLYGELPLYVTLLLFAVAGMFIASWQLSLIVGVFGPVLFLVLASFGKQIRRGSRRKQATIANVMDDLQQTLAGIRIVKAFGTEKLEEQSFGERLGQYFKHAMKVSRARVASRTTLVFLTNLSIPIVLLVGGWVLIEGLFGGLSPGRFTAFIVVMAMTYLPMKVLVKGYNVLQESLAGGERIFELLDREAELEDSSDAVDLARVKSGVAYRGISFAYDSGENGRAVLRDVSFQIGRGEVVALVGETGSGKSTLVDLLFRFYDPDGGAIEIDGVDLRKIRRQSLLEHLAVVTQEPFLFNASIRDNIRYGRRDASQAEIEEAARLARIHDLIASLPQGYDTVVGERGANLSGGERQRVTIARAILRNADILILDEATSSLDSRAEKEVQAALDNLMEDRTTLVIAHRLSTIVGADRIVVLQDGRIAEMGSHDDLMGRDGVYRRLFEIQKSGMETGAAPPGDASGKDEG